MEWLSIDCFDNDGTTQVAEGSGLIHPNNYGMELIAKRIVAQLKLG